ncbi:MAG: pitrilysin family protein [Cyanobacteria bacterium P01_A01_bin.105]
MVRLDSGLTVIHQEIAATPVAVVDVWVKAGASREPTDWMGMAHFLEHMVFKGTERLLPGMFDQAIESRGGMTNAATSHDYAHFYMTLAADDLPDTLPYLADLLLHPAIPADEFWRERQVVLEEILQAQDDPDWLGYQAFSELLYGNHPYGRPVLGTPDILKGRSPEEMRQFHQAYYQPENITVVVAGGIGLDHTLDLVQHAFRPFAPPTDCPAVAPPPTAPLRQVQRAHMTLPQLQQGRLMMAWLAPGIVDLETACGLDLLATVLAGGRASRLVQELQEDRQWVLEVDGSFALQRDSSLVNLTFWLEPERVSQVEQVVCDRMSALANEPITAAELLRCQRLLCNDYAFSTETPGQIAGLYGYYGTIAQPELSVIYPDLVRAHTRETLQSLAQQYLSPERYAAMVLEPAESSIR